MDQLNDTALFDKYLHKELSPEEIKDFKDRLKNDAQFHQDFEVHKTIIDSLIAMGGHSLKTELDTIHQNREKQLKKRIGFYLFLGSLVLVAIWLVKLEHVLPTKHTLEDQPIQKTTVNNLPKQTSPAVTDSSTVNSSTSKTVIEQPKANIQREVVKDKKPTAFIEKAAGTKIIYLARFAKQAQYMYFNNTVHLVGCKDLTPHHVDLRIRKNKLYLFHKNTYYELAEATTWTNAEPVKDTRNFGTLQHATGKSIKINVLIHPMKVERSSEQLHIFTTDSVPHTNWYQVKNKRLVVSTKVQNKVNEAKIVRYKNMLYVKSSSKLFDLNTNGAIHKFKSTKIEDWKGKRIIEIHIKPKYLNFEDTHHLEQSN